MIDAIYKGYVSRPVVAWPLLMPYVRHVCVLLHLIMPHVKYAHLGLHIGVSLKGRAVRIWSFGCGFACAITMACAGLKLLFGIIIRL